MWYAITVERQHGVNNVPNRVRRLQGDFMHVARYAESLIVSETERDLRFTIWHGVAEAAVVRWEGDRRKIDVNADVWAHERLALAYLREAIKNAFEVALDFPAA